MWHPDILTAMRFCQAAPRRQSELFKKRSWRLSSFLEQGLVKEELAVARAENKLLNEAPMTVLLLLLLLLRCRDRCFERSFHRVHNMYHTV